MSASKRNPRPAHGLFPTLQERSKMRRETQKKLLTIRDDARSRPGRRNDLIPDLQVNYLAVDRLKPAKRRVRKIDAIQAARIDRSVAEFGVCVPVLINGENIIVHGHGVFEAAKRAGLEKIPTIEVSHLSSEKQRALAITLNRLGETGVWDEEALALELEELLDLGEDVIVTGFDLPEIDALLLEDEPSESAEALPAVPVSPVSRPDDLWRLGNHLLLQGDALDQTSYRCLFSDGGMARIVLTDEPYNVPVVGHVTSKTSHKEFAIASGELSVEEFASFNRTWIDFSQEHVVDGGVLATFIDWRSVGVVLDAGRDSGLELLNIIAWVKTNGGQGSLWRSQHELLPFFKKGVAPHVNNVQLGRYGRWRSNVWTYAGASSLGSEARANADHHPTPKPRAMLEDALLDVSNRGEIVLDPFLGSGSTLVAAETTGRVCRAIEIDGRYCDVSIQRWQNLTGEAAVLFETGETFAEVAEQRAHGNADREARHG